MCQHLKFNAQVHVHRIVEDNRLTFNAELAVRCGECGEVFEFLGMQTGISQTQPTTGINGTTARLPIAPARLKQDQTPPADKPMVPGLRQQGRVRKSVDDVPRPSRPSQTEATPVAAPPALELTDISLVEIVGSTKQDVSTTPAMKPEVEQTPPPHEPVSEPVTDQASEPSVTEPTVSTPTE